jgi:phage terminase large subunit
LILNPVTSEHWIYKRFFAGKVMQQEFNGVIGNTTYIHTTYEDNRSNLSESFLQKVDECRANNPKKYLHTYRGHWLEKAEGVIFTNTEVGEFDESLPYVYGLDFGFNPDPDALVKVAIDKKQKVIYLDEMLYKNGQGSQNLINQLTMLINKRDLIIADLAGGRLVEDIKKAGFNIIAPGKIKIIEGLKIMLDYKIVYTERSHNLHKELNNYCWSDRKAGNAIDAYNHALDAARYSVIYLTKGVGTIRSSLTDF